MCLCTPLAGLFEMILLPEVFTAQIWTRGFGPPSHGKRSILKALLWPPLSQSKRQQTNLMSLLLQTFTPRTSFQVLTLARTQGPAPPQPFYASCSPSRMSAHLPAGPHTACHLYLCPWGSAYTWLTPHSPLPCLARCLVCNYLSSALSLLPWADRFR